MYILLKIFIVLFLLNNIKCQEETEEIRTPFPKYIHELNSNEWQLLDDGFNHARSTGFLRRYANMHASHFRSAHDNPLEFFPFHGQMVRDLEKVLRDYDERLTLPIWDLKTQPVYPGHFYIMTRDWPEIRRNLPPNYPLAPNIATMLRNINYNTNYMAFISYCSFIHNEIHNNYGGTFGSPHSPLDPMFWAFHAFWEEQYTIWTQVNGVRKQLSALL